MQASFVNGVKVYDLSQGKTLHEFLQDATSIRDLKKNKDYSRRIELIQDFQFPTSSQRIRFTRDGSHVFASGVYPPMIKCFDLDHLSNKFTRNLTNEILDFQVLSPDFRKICLLQTNRNVEFHAAYGSHFKMRIPKSGRSLIYSPLRAEVLIGADGSNIFRINLELGRFVTPFQISTRNNSDNNNNNDDDDESINVLIENPPWNLTIAGSDAGRLHVFDSRVGNELSSLSINSNSIREITALSLDTGDNLTIAVGDDTGIVTLYDLRSDNVLSRFEIGYDMPIRDVVLHQFGGSRKVVAADKNIIKIWDRSSGSLFTSIEPGHPINSFCISPMFPTAGTVSEDATKEGSGVILAATETEKVGVFFCPELGPAPRWASFLETLSEELEEDSSKVLTAGADSNFENYRFVTKEELGTLGLTPLLGTELVRAHMHGYFIDIKLYRKAKSIIEPFEVRSMLRLSAKQADRRG